MLPESRRRASMKPSKKSASVLASRRQTIQKFRQPGIQLWSWPVSGAQRGASRRWRLRYAAKVLPVYGKWRYRSRVARLIERESCMNEHDFEQQLKADGFRKSSARSLIRAGKSRHRHHFGIRGLVISGTFVVEQAGEAVIYRCGEIFSVRRGANCTTEEVDRGRKSAHLLVGRKYFRGLRPDERVGQW